MTAGQTETIALRDASYRWPGPAGFSLSVAHFAVQPSERVLLVGPSGSGKSTLLSLLTGIIAPSAGEIIVLGNDMTRLSSGGRDSFRAEHFGVIFQMFNLLPYGSVVDNVVLPLSFAPKRKSRLRAPRDEAVRLLEALGLPREAYQQTQAAHMSVGQQQRVAAARALIGQPEIIIADEPTSALDRNRQRSFMELLFEEVRAAKSSLIMVSHEENLGNLFDRVVRLEDVALTRRAGAAV